MHRIQRSLEHLLDYQDCEIIYNNRIVELESYYGDSLDLSIKSWLNDCKYKNVKLTKHGTKYLLDFSEYEEDFAWEAEDLSKISIDYLKMIKANDIKPFTLTTGTCEGRYLKNHV